MPPDLAFRGSPSVARHPTVARTNGTPGRCTRDPWARCSWARSTCAPGADKESLRGREQTRARARARADSLSRVIIIRQFGPAANSLAREARGSQGTPENTWQESACLSRRECEPFAARCRAAGKTFGGSLKGTTKRTRVRS